MDYPQTTDLKIVKSNEQDKSITTGKLLNLPMNSETCNFLTECMRRPKIAKNIYDARNIIKLRKKLKQISEANKHLYESKILKTDVDSNDNEKKVTGFHDNSLMNSKSLPSLEKQKDTETLYLSPASNFSDILKHTVVKLKGTESTQDKNLLKENANNAIVKSDCSDVYTNSVSAKSKTNLHKNIRKGVINKLNNLGSVPCNNSITEINCVQYSQEIETKGISNTNELLNCTEKLPIQSNIIDSAYDDGKIIKNVMFKTCTTKESVACSTPKSVAPVSCKSVKKRKSSSQQPKCTVKTSPDRKRKLKKPKQNGRSDLSECADIKMTCTFRNTPQESASTLNNNNPDSLFLDESLQTDLLKVCKPLRTYMMNVYKPIRTYTRRKINKMDTNKVITSPFANDNFLKTPCETLEASAANESEQTNSDGKLKPSAADEFQVKVANADERILKVTDGTTSNPIVTNNSNEETLDNTIHSCKLTISDGDLKIADGKLKIPLNTNIPSDMLNNSNVAGLQLPRNIVLKIVKPATSDGNENEVQLISANNVKLVLNTDISGSSKSTSSRVDVDGTITAKADRASAETNSVVSQIDCDSQEDLLSQKVCKPNSIKQQMPSMLKPSSKEDTIIRQVTEQCLLHHQKLCASRTISGTADNQEDVLTGQIIEPHLIKSRASRTDSQEDMLKEKVTEPCLVDVQPHLVNREKSNGTQTDVFSSTAVVESSMAYSEMPEQSQQYEVSEKENDINNSCISDLNITTETISEDSAVEKCINETNNSLNSSVLCNLIKTNFLKIMATSADEEIKEDGRRQTAAADSIFGGTKRHRETCTDKEKISQSKYKHKVNWNIECTKVSLMSSPNTDVMNQMKSKQEPNWRFSLENRPSAHVECLKRKKHYCVSEGDTKKCIKQKHKKISKIKNCIRNSNLISMRSKHNSNNLQHGEQTVRNKQQDVQGTGILQEEKLNDGTGICVKLSIAPDGTPKIIKPRFAKNILEVRKIIKMEKKLQHKINKMLKNKQRGIVTSSEPKKMHKKCISKCKLADLLVSPFDTSKSIVPNFLLPNVCVQRLDLNSVNRKVSSYHKKYIKRHRRRKDRSDNSFVMNNEQDHDSDKSVVNFNCNDSNNSILEQYNVDFYENKFQPVTVIDFPHTEQSLSNFGEQISQPAAVKNVPLIKPNYQIYEIQNFDGWLSQPVIVEEIPQIEQLFPYSCMTNLCGI